MRIQRQTRFIYARRFSPRRWSFLGFGSEKKWYSTHEHKPQGEWDSVDKICRQRTPSFPIHDSIIQRSAQKQRWWKIVSTLLAIMMGSGEIIYDKLYASPRPPPKISFKHDWMKELGSEVAGGGKDSQQTQPKTQHPIVGTGRLVWQSNHPVL